MTRADVCYRVALTTNKNNPTASDFFYLLEVLREVFSEHIGIGRTYVRKDRQARVICNCRSTSKRQLAEG